MGALGIVLPGTGPDGRGRGAAGDHDRLADRTGVAVRTTILPIDHDVHRVGALARRGHHPVADAVLVPDTAMPTAGLLDTLEEDAGVPVLTANQVTFWHALQLAAPSRAVDGLGALSRR